VQSVVLLFCSTLIKKVTKEINSLYNIIKKDNYILHSVEQVLLHSVYNYPKKRYAFSLRVGKLPYFALKPRQTCKLSDNMGNALKSASKCVRVALAGNAFHFRLSVPTIISLSHRTPRLSTTSLQGGNSPTPQQRVSACVSSCVNSKDVPSFRKCSQNFQTHLRHKSVSGQSYVRERLFHVRVRFGEMWH
jgi:hypothetical protein